MWSIGNRNISSVSTDCISQYYLWINFANSFSCGSTTSKIWFGCMFSITYSMVAYITCTSTNLICRWRQSTSFKYLFRVICSTEVINISNSCQQIIICGILLKPPLTSNSITTHSKSWTNILFFNRWNIISNTDCSGINLCFTVIFTNNSLCSVNISQISSWFKKFSLSNFFFTNGKLFTTTV